MTRAAMMAGIVLAWILQIALDLIGTWYGGALGVLGDIVLGGLQVYLAFRLYDGPRQEARERESASRLQQTAAQAAARMGQGPTSMEPPSPRTWRSF